MDQRLKTSLAAAAGVVTGLSATSRVLAQDGAVVVAGNGGGATASANGGAVGLGDIDSGFNSGSAIGVGDTYGGVVVDGGFIANSTDLGVSATGGTAIADASGGNDNVAFVS